MARKTLWEVFVSNFPRFRDVPCWDYTVSSPVSMDDLAEVVIRVTWLRDPPVVPPEKNGPGVVGEYRFNIV